MPLTLADIKNSAFFFLGGDLDPRIAENGQDAPKGCLYALGALGSAPLMLQKQSALGGDPNDWVECGGSTPPEFDAGNSGAAKSLALDAHPSQLLTLTADCDIALTGSVDGGIYSIRLLQNGVGGHTPTFTDTILWEGGTPPALQAADINTLVVITDLGGILFGSSAAYT